MASFSGPFDPNLPDPDSVQLPAGAGGVNRDVRRAMTGVEGLTEQGILDEFNRLFLQEAPQNQGLGQIFSDLFTNRNMVGNMDPFNIGLPILRQLSEGGYTDTFSPLFTASTGGNNGGDNTSSDGAWPFQGGFGKNPFLNFIGDFGSPNVDTLNRFWSQYGPRLEEMGWGFARHHVDPKFQAPDGSYIDVIQGAGGQSPAWQWLVEGAGGSHGGGFSGGGGGGAIDSSLRNVAQPILGVGQSVSNQQNALADLLREQFDLANQKRTENQGRIDDLYSTLQERAAQSLEVNRDDPTIRPMTDAFTAQTKRTERDFVSDLAERMGPYATGAMTGQSRMMAESMGQRNAAFEAELMTRELQTRRDEISDALNSMAGVLSAEQVVDLQNKLGILDAAIQQNRTAADLSLGESDLNLRKYGIDVGAATAQDELGLRRYLGDLESVLARERLGFDIGSFNSQLLLQLLLAGG